MNTRAAYRKKSYNRRKLRAVVNKRKKNGSGLENKRLKVLWYGFMVFSLLIIMRLFVLQIVDHGFYEALASGQYQFYEKLFPERGTIYTHDQQEDKIYPVATNVDLGFVYADPRHVENADDTAEKIAEILGFSEEQLDELKIKLEKEDDPYEPIKHKVPEELLQEIKQEDLPGISFVREAIRNYPESSFGGHVIGFLGAKDDGSLFGAYGIEGYFNEELSGEQGFIESERDAAGRLIAVGERSYKPAVDGADIVLTIDRNIQYEVCRMLKEAVQSYQADGGSVIVLEPQTGKVLAMCGSPDFNPNEYNKVEDINVYNNPAIFNAYEPGSIFKSITMAAAIDSGAVTPGTTYEDTGEVKIDEFTIRNSDGKAHGIKSMTQVLEESLNTGVIFAMREMARDVFQQYVQDFGFGTYTGIELSTEVPGTIALLDEWSEVYPATASYGQGITVTPLQMAAAYAAIANGGKLMQPYIVDEIRYSDGRIKKSKPTQVRQVISERTSRLVGAMLISVVENGHATKAGVPGYYIAGKTGTAEIARTDAVGYLQDATIGSFAGYGPVNDPKFVMVTRIDRPRTSPWAASTAAPLFGNIADFLLRYFEVPPERSIE